MAPFFMACERGIGRVEKVKEKKTFKICGVCMDAYSGGGTAYDPLFCARQAIKQKGG